MFYTSTLRPTGLGVAKHGVGRKLKEVKHCSTPYLKVYEEKGIKPWCSYKNGENQSSLGEITI